MQALVASMGTASKGRVAFGRRDELAKTDVKYLVFDVESVADGKLISEIRFPGEQVPPREAVARFREELMAERGSDFIPYTFQVPISVVVAKVDSNFRLIDIVLLDEPEFQPHEITKKFWLGWTRYKHPTLVTFNGRSFDIPLLELAAFRFGVPIPDWFSLHGRAYEQPRNRYNTAAHFDLHDVLVNYGASRFNGGLNLAATLLGKPGKMEVQGDMVQDMFDQGQLSEINDYCRCDVLDTYFVFLRVSVLTGKLTLEAEQALMSQTQAWLEERQGESKAYQQYLNEWGDWKNPWSAD